MGDLGLVGLFLGGDCEGWSEGCSDGFGEFVEGSGYTGVGDEDFGAAVDVEPRAEFVYDLLENCEDLF